MVSRLKSLLQRIGRWFKQNHPAKTAATLLLSAVSLGLLIFLLDTGSDWRDAWPDDLEEWKNPKLEILVHTGLWWGGLVSLALCIVLLATSRWWLRPLPDAQPNALPEVRLATFWLPVMLAMIVGAVLSWQRLGVSLNDDETYNLRRYIMGSYKLDEQQQPQFKATDWHDAWFENRGADNHIPFTLAARTSLGLWQQLAGTDGKHFNEVALRLPAWLAAVAGIGTLALFLWVAGFPRAAVLSAWLAALHPWWLRFATEATGYSLAALWIPLVCGAAMLALRSGRWLWWLVWAACQYFLLYSVLGSVYFVLLLNLALAVTLLMRWKLSSKPLPMQFRRFAVSLAVSLIPLVFLMAPSAYQIARYLVVDRVDQAMGWPWVRNIWGLLTTGCNWSGSGFVSPLIKTVESLKAEGWLLPLILSLLAIPLVIYGAHRLATSRRSGAVVCAAALTLSGPLLFALAADYNSFLLDRYLFFYLPGIIAFCALAIDGIIRLLERLRLPAVVAILPAVVGVALFGIGTHPQRQVLMNNPKENLQAVAKAIHGQADPQLVPSSEVLRGHVWSSISHYDPWSRNTPFDTDLLALMREALEKDVPMYYSFGYRSRAMTEAPVKAAVELAENPLLFEHLGTFYSLEQDQFTHRLFKFRGKAAQPHLPASGN